ncbi:MAG TPA: DUF4394 domain-containing protein [Dokdonella sp.]
MTGSAAAVGAAAGPSGGAIVLYVTMDVIPPWGYGDDCGTLDASNVSANVGDHVHLCYIGLNNTAQTLNLHSLANDIDGDLFTGFDVNIPPGNQQNLAELRFTVRSTRDLVHTWTASDGAGGDTFTTTTQTHLEALAPTVELSQTTFDATAAPGEVIYQPLSIASIGSADLSWHFGESAATGNADGSSLAMHTPTNTRSAPAAPAGTPATIPAYAVEIAAAGNRYVALDLAAPSTPLVVAGATLPDIVGGTFIDDDFSHEYLLSDSGGLLEIDTQTGAVDTINALTAPLAGELGWHGLAWDPHARVLYALSTDGTLPTLYEIDPLSGATNRIGAINDRTLTVNGIFSAIAVDSDGRIFAIDQTNDLLVAVALDHYNLPDRVSGYTIGSLGIDVEGLASLAFDGATDTLYLSAIDAAAGTNGMYTLDPVTGAATPLSSIGNPDSRYLALAAVGSARPCGVAVDVAWLSVSTYVEPPLPPGEEVTDNVIFDATDLAPGSYDATLCLHTNDATRRKIPLPVHLTVATSEQGSIFRAGFEGGTR